MRNDFDPVADTNCSEKEQLSETHFIGKGYPTELWRAS